MTIFLSENSEAIYATDVLADELSSISENILLNYPHQSQIIITPHIGGMTKESKKSLTDVQYGCLKVKFMNQISFLAINKSL